jgi:hypothetical protein
MIAPAVHVYVLKAAHIRRRSGKRNHIIQDACQRFHYLVEHMRLSDGHWVLKRMSGEHLRQVCQGMNGGNDIGLEAREILKSCMFTMEGQSRAASAILIR